MLAAVCAKVRIATLAVKLTLDLSNKNYGAETNLPDLRRTKLPVYKPDDDHNNIHEIGYLLTKYGIKERNKACLNRRRRDVIILTIISKQANPIVTHFINHNHSGHISSNDLGYVAYACVANNKDDKSGDSTISLTSRNR